MEKRLWGMGLRFLAGLSGSRHPHYAPKTDQLDIATEIVGQVGQADSGADARQPDILEYRTVHAVFDITEDMFDQKADLRLPLVV